MDVYLVPLGRRGYELYCEAEDHAGTPEVETGTGDSAGSAGGILRRARRRTSVFFRDALAFLERERQARLSRRAAKPNRTVLQRIRDRVLGWLAERVAEQRLLWQLRHTIDAAAHHPDDMRDGEAERLVMDELRHDAARHLRWGALSLAGALVFVPLTFIPGPNVPAYYFWFRVIGHTLSYLGARQGLTKVRWRYVASRPLAELRDLAGLTGEVRVARARDIAAKLPLAHLEQFIERLLLGTA